MDPVRRRDPGREGVSRRKREGIGGREAVAVDEERKERENINDIYLTRQTTTLISTIYFCCTAVAVRCRARTDRTVGVGWHFRV